MAVLPLYRRLQDRNLDLMIHVVYGSKVIESAAQQHDMLCNPTRYSCSKQELACLQA